MFQPTTQSGDEVSGVELVLLHQQTYKVRGRVVNAVTNHPGGQMRVEIVPEDPYSQAGGESRSAFPDEDTGEFEVGGIPGGRYTAFAAWSDGENTYMGSAPLETFNGSAESVRIIVTRGTDLRGRISVEGSAVVFSDLRVSVIPRETRLVGSTKTAEVKSDGTFLVTGLADGRYDVDVYSRCEVCYLKAATAGGSDIFDMGLHISTGSAPPPIELVYSGKTGAVDGTVLREDGLAASGAKVVLAPDHPRNDNFSGYLGYREADTDQYGRFIVNGVPPGNYRAFTWQSVDYDNYTDPGFLKPYEKKAQALTIGADEKKTLQLVLISTSSKNH